MTLRQSNEFRLIIRHFLKNILGVVGFLIVVLIVFCAIFADLIVPYDPVALNIKERLQPPSLSHFLGTDQLGRDIFSRMVMGSRVALQVALPTVFGAVSIGFLLGMMAGFGPKWLDNAIILLLDTLRSFPTVMFALAVVALVGPSLETVIFIIIATSIPTYGRVVRTQTLSIKSEEFILAEKSMGASTSRILLVHILPNIFGPVAVLAAMEVPTIIGLEAGLSFLGMGVRPPTPSWGSLLNEGYALIRNTPWLLIAGGVPLIVTTLGFTFLGETLRDAVDPKLRKSS